jgi:sugar lactone lactonase YvrE
VAVEALIALLGGHVPMLAAFVLIVAPGLALVPVLPRLARRHMVTALAAAPALGFAASSVALITVASVGLPLNGLVVRLVPAALVALGLALRAGGEPVLRFPRDEALAAAALVVAVAAGIVLEGRVIKGSPVPGNDWAKYVLYADEIRLHGSLLIDNPFWMLGVPFREDPGTPAVYGSYLVMTGQSATVLVHGIWVFAVMAILSTFAFVRSLWGTRINAGVWGTAAFPSVYRTDVHPFAFLPHSIRWQTISFLMTLAGAAVAATREHQWAATLLLGCGVVGLAVTIAKNITYATRSEVDSLKGSKLWYRAAVAYLHFIQPLARLRGRVRGVLTPPEVVLPHAQKQTSRGPRPSWAEARRALLLISGSVTEDRFWSETWTTADRVLAHFSDWLRRSRAVRSIETDEGWSDDRDVSVFAGRWAWLDVRALVEEHGGGKSLVRISMHLRPTMFGFVAAAGLGAALLGGAAAGVALRWPLAGSVVAGLTVLLVAAVLWRTAQATAIARRGIHHVTVGSGMIAMPSGPARVPLIAPSILRMYGLRSAFIFAVMILSIGASTLMLREAATGPVIGGRKGYAGDYGPAIEAWLDSPNGIVVSSNGDIYFADSNNHTIRRIDARNNPDIEPVAGNHDLGGGFSGDNGPAILAQLDTPDGVTIAPDGDVIVADSHNDRVRRVDRQTGVIITVAGSGENGYDGDDKPAVDAALNTPSAVAAAPNGDIYIADTLNYRVRMIEAKTGLIHTIAGDGSPGESGSDEVGDGGPATSAHLNMPSDVAIERTTGDIYIADMHHNRIRKVDARTRIITTVAGTGKWGYSGDDGPATRATLAGPAGVAVVAEPNGTVTIFIADYYNGHVRAVGPDGIIRDLSDEGRTAFGAPTRVAFATSGPRRGWLYVADSSQDKIVPLIIPKIAPNLVPPRPIAPPRRVGG